MSFIENHPNYKLYSEPDNYYFNEVPYPAWTELESLIIEGGGEQLYYVVQLLSTKVRAGILTGSAIQFIPELICKLKDKVKDGKFDLFMDCLAMLCTEGELEISSINDFLKDNHIGYVAERDSWNQGIFWNKIGEANEKEVNEKMNLTLNESVTNIITSKRSLNKMVEGKQTKIFITHSKKDVEYVKILTDLLESMKVPTEYIVCTSIPQYKIPNGINAYEWLRKQFIESNLHMIFVLSNNYFSSNPCLNEMGAAWLTAKKSDLLLLPGFDFSDLKEQEGCLDKNIQGVCMDDNDDIIKAWLANLRDDVIAEFNLSTIYETRWEEYRNKFIKDMKSIYNKKGSPIFDF